MKKSSFFIFCITFIPFFSGIIFVATNTAYPDCADKEQQSGAYQSLNLFGLSRAYPDAEIPAQAHYAAWELAKKNQDISRSSQTDPWETIGPENHGGRTLELAFNPQNYNTMYAGSASGGLWRSYTAGEGPAAWEHVPTGFPVLGVSSIAFAPADSMVMYIGTGEVYNVDAAGTGAAYRSTRGSYGMGILKSIDGGNSWEKSLDWSYNQSQGIWDIKISNQNPNKVITATTDGVYLSEDAGANWVQVLDVKMANSILIHPDDDETIIVGCGNFGSTGFGIYKSANNGADWNQVTSDLPEAFNGKIQLEQAPSASSVIYASIGNGFGSDGASWLCRSNDFGSSWTIQNTLDYSKWQGWFSHDVAVSPDNPDKIIVIGIEVWRSTDGGLNLEQISTGGIGYDTPPLEGPDGDPDFVHSDCHDVIYHPTDGEQFYVASDGGIHHSENHGNSFHSRNGGYQSVQFYNGFSNSHQDSIFCIGGLQDNGTIYRSEGVIWTRVFGGDGSWTGVASNDDNRIYVSYQNLNIHYSTSQGNIFAAIAPNSSNENTAFIAPFVLANDDPGIVYAGRSRVYKTTNSGSNWETTNNNNVLDGNPVLSMAISPENADVVYAATAPTSIFGGTRGNVFVTTNGGDSWSNITQDLPDRFPMDMTVDPTNQAIAYVVFSGFGTGHVFKTDDFGENWTDISPDLPDVPTNAVIVDPLFPDNIYIGNDLGVFASVDGGLNWESYQEGLFDAVMVFDLKIAPVNRKLRAATHGNGAFQRDLLEDNVNVHTSTIYEKNFEITVYPNPVKDHATVSYFLDKSSNVIALLYNQHGQLVQSIFGKKQLSGWHNFTLSTSSLASGTYFLKMETEGIIHSKSIIVL